MHDGGVLWVEKLSTKRKTYGHTYINKPIWKETYEITDTEVPYAT